MDGAPTDFWAKLEQEDNQVTAWHPLIHHCADVAACAKALLTRSLLGQRLAQLGGLPKLTDGQIARLSVLAAVHDVGKFNLGFQNRKDPQPPFRAGHLSELLGPLFQPGYRWHEQLLQALPVAELQTWSEDLEGLLVATISHHGRPIPVPTESPNPRLWEPQHWDPFAGLADLFARTREWFPEAWQSSAEPLPANPEFQHAWCGLLNLADWLGSDEERFFPFSDSLDDDRMAFARERAQHALGQLGLDAAPYRRELGTTPVGYEMFPHVTSLRPAQQTMLDVGTPQEPSVTILEAETGSGKTEAAMVHFLRLYQAGEVDGLYFALPTRTAATQIYDRVRRAVAEAFPSSERPPVVLGVPGYLTVDVVEGAPLPGFQVQWPDDERERFRYRGWAVETPKRYLAGAITVGTVDQVLLSTLAVSHAHLRATTLLRQLLVVDEVHASDVYMSRLLESVLDQHLASGGHALLMSATLGSRARTRFLAPPDERDRVELPSPSEAIDTSYPLVARGYRDRDPAFEAVATSGTDKQVQASLVPRMNEAGAIAEMGLEAAEAGARVLILRNTVAGCRAVQEQLETLAADRRAGLLRCQGTVAPHHSRFAKADRETLDAAIETEFGLTRPSGEGLVAVATQTVEQSLDLDADLMITDLCPMDVLLQRIGRLHRHSRPRPAGFEAARVHVLHPDRSDLTPILTDSGEARGPHGLGTVYADARILQATWELLRKEPDLRVPGDNRRLVEAATHPELLEDLVARLGDRWPDHRDYLHGEFFADRRQAQRNQVQRGIAFSEAEGRRVCFPDDRRIPTRLGEEDRRVAFPNPPESPFGNAVPEMTVPGWLPQLGEVDAQTHQATHVETEAAGFTFRFGPLPFRYDRLGLHLAGSER